ncbi:F-box only 22-like [Paramuricea clavata]|uniref:F-box only 22-like n=1 Tax=Paramuricea clavata TaxID=317549 RepID=A0A7D9HCH0_PARCT|nr:F-box only 22-like [Paramuricea clavata]
MDSNTVRNITALPPETLANILSFLPARSLVNALLVCRLWKDLAQRELTQRKYFVSRVFKCRKDELTFQIVIDDIRKQILEFLNDIDIVPSAMVMLCYEIFDPMTLAEFRKKLLSKITDNLPKDCIVIGEKC